MHSAIDALFAHCLVLLPRWISHTSYTIAFLLAFYPSITRIIVWHTTTQFAIVYTTTLTRTRAQSRKIYRTCVYVARYTIARDSFSYEFLRFDDLQTKPSKFTNNWICIVYEHDRPRYELKKKRKKTRFLFEFTKMVRPISYSSRASSRIK